MTPRIIQSMEFSRPEYWSGYSSQEIFPMQGSNPGLLHCRWILYQLSHLQGPEVSSHNCTNTFFTPFSLFSFWDIYNVNVDTFDFVPEVPSALSHSLSFFNLSFLLLCYQFPLFRPLDQHAFFSIM